MLLILSSAPGAHAGWVKWVDSSVRDFSITSMRASRHAIGAIYTPYVVGRRRPAAQNKKAEAVLIGFGFLHCAVIRPGSAPA
jgi:hypothetical protein